MDASNNLWLLLLLAGSSKGGLSPDLVDALLSSSDALDSQMRQLVALLLSQERSGERAGAALQLAEEVVSAFSAEVQRRPPLNENSITAFPRLQALLATLPPELRARLVGPAPEPSTTGTELIIANPTDGKATRASNKVSERAEAGR